MTRPNLADLTSKPMAGKKNWIKSATKHSHGQFRAKAEHAGESTHEFAEAHKGDSGKTGKQARLALALMGASGHTGKKKRDHKLYDNPKSHPSD